jgi:hypothetical protein
MLGLIHVTKMFKEDIKLAKFGISLYPLIEMSPSEAELFFVQAFVAELHSPCMGHTRCPSLPWRAMPTQFGLLLFNFLLCFDYNKARL